MPKRNMEIGGDEVPMSDELKRRKVDRNSTDEEFDTEKFKEICPEDITVAIFCALSCESVAVKYSLDEEFECRPKAIGPRKYVYSFGRIEDHKLVIARPHQMGTVKAAQCATTVCQQFPNVRFALMVGIGAGIPSLPRNDIRLGDIAVSIPRDNHPGVLQYDFGKYESDGTFVLKGSLNKPPPILVSADGSLEEDEMMGRRPLRKILRNITKQRGYARPNSGDALFDQSFHHVKKGDDCSGCEASSEKKVVPRAEREPGQPVIHRGLMLSGSGVVKNPEDRDRLRRDHDDAICFEMEAAGIMDEIPCLVVRGICDYADTHKQDGWHHYASAVAAAYGKAVLLKIYSQDVEETRCMKETMEKLEKNMNEIRNKVHDMEQELNDTGEVIRKQALATEHKKILDWLPHIDYAPQQINFLSRQQPGTGQWLLGSEMYRTWVNASKQTLFCPGIPGAGKTVITSIVVDDLRTTFRNEPSTGIAYIYCDFRRQDDQKVRVLLASLLKQLAETRSSLPQSVKKLYDRHKDKRSQPSLDEVLETLHSVVGIYSKIYFIIDALDECQTSNGCRTKFLAEIFGLQAKSGANVFATSRFLPEITEKFKGSISTEIRATDEDVRRYIDGHMPKLPNFVGYSSERQKELQQELQEEIKTAIATAVNGVFLLAQLYLNELDNRRSPRDIRDILRAFRKKSEAQDGDNMKVLHSAYDQAMERINNQTGDSPAIAKDVLSWITYAKRPLSPSELQHALAVRVGEFELDKSSLPEINIMLSACVGLVMVDEESDIIQLVHYTTQEYLERTQNKWFSNAEFDITKVCVTYLSFTVFESGYCITDRAFKKRLRTYQLYDYAAHNWGHHARSASAFYDGITKFLESKTKVNASYQALMQHGYLPPRWGTGLHLAAYFGVEKAVDALLQKGVETDPQDSCGWTPLSYGAQEGYHGVVKLLLETGKVKIDSKSSSGYTPLLLAAKNGHEAVFRLLLEKKADANSRDGSDRTPLSLAVEKGFITIVKLLLETGEVAIDSKDKIGRNPLLFAAKNGHEAIVKLLLVAGTVDVHSREFGQTPLGWAATRGYEAIVQLLLQSGKANADSNERGGWSPLSIASEKGFDAIVRLLLEVGGADANIKVIGGHYAGRTPLSIAAEKGHDSTVELLLEIGKADANSKDTGGYYTSRTPLSIAAEKGYDAIVKLLLEKGVNVDSKNRDGRTPLSFAAEKGHDTIAKLLLEIGGADANSKSYWRTPLWFATANGHESVVQLILNTGSVDVDLKDEDGRTVLRTAVENGYAPIAKLLLNKGGNVDSKDKCDRTLLLSAAQFGHGSVVKLLLDNGANVGSKDNSGQTPLSWAARNGYEAVVKLLLITDGVVADSRDHLGRTPLSWAAEKGQEPVVKLLLDTDKIDADARDWRDRTPLSYAAENGHEIIVSQLLGTGKVHVDRRDRIFGRTPLSRAAQFGRTAVVRLLLATGQVDTDSRDNDGRTPLSWATEASKTAHFGIKEEYEAVAKFLKFVK